MPGDDLQAAWQAQDPPTLQVDADALLRLVNRNRWSLRATVFWRDVREVGAGLILLPASWYISRYAGDQWLLLGVAGLWVIGYLLVDRWRHRRRAGIAVDRPLLECVEESLTEVEHQIQLLKGVWRWYALPLTLAGLVASGWTMLEADGPARLRWGVFAYQAAVLLVVHVAVCRLNRWAVESELIPRAEELKAVRESVLRAGEK